MENNMDEVNINKGEANIYIGGVNINKGGVNINKDGVNINNNGGMDDSIKEYVDFLRNVKHSSENTVMAYERDLNKFKSYCRNCGITGLSSITSTRLNGYILWLEKNGFASTTISRYVTTMKSFFHYLLNSGKISGDPAFLIKGPVVERPEKKIVEWELIDKLLSQPETDTAKGIRDKAMMELMCSTGMKVSEIISLEIDDLKIDERYVVCNNGRKERVLFFNNKVGQFLKKYVEIARPEMIKDTGCTKLFVSCKGEKMSRQGYWKNIKTYCAKAGINNINSSMLRDAFAAALIRQGESADTIKEALGYVSVNSINQYR